MALLLCSAVQAAKDDLGVDHGRNHFPRLCFRFFAT
jgi:hypothetical protein